MSENNELRVRRRNSRLLISDSNSSNVLGSVIGYAQEPLLPLDQACAPLVDIVHDILTYVFLALKHTPPEPAEGLTCDESASIRLYTMEWTDGHRSFYSILNNTLKTADREHLRPWFKYLKLFLTALAKIQCAPPLTAWRGLRKNISDEFPSGATVTWWAFSSCTMSLPVLENHLYLGNTGERTLFSIEIFNGRSIRVHSDFETEDEILLLEGTYMEVQSQLNPAPDLHIIHLKQKIPKEILLEHPFEDACIYPKFLPETFTTSSERHWYNKKRFFISMSLLLFVVSLVAILGGVLGSRSNGNSTNTTHECLTYKCDFSRYINVSSVYFGFERLSFNCSQSLSNITVVIAVQTTVGATFAAQYNTFWTNTIEQTYQNTSSAILYMWRIISGQTIQWAGFPYYAEAQYLLQGTNQTVSNDTYSFNAQFTGCGSQVVTYNGHF